MATARGAIEAKPTSAYARRIAESKQVEDYWGRCHHRRPQLPDVQTWHEIAPRFFWMMSIE
jgi:hypothetical protein